MSLIRVPELSADGEKRRPLGMKIRQEREEGRGAFLDYELGWELLLGPVQFGEKVQFTPYHLHPQTSLGLPLLCAPPKPSFPEYLDEHISSFSLPLRMDPGRKKR